MVVEQRALASPIARIHRHARRGDSGKPNGDASPKHWELSSDGFCQKFGGFHPLTLPVKPGRFSCKTSPWLHGAFYRTELFIFCRKRAWTFGVRLAIVVAHPAATLAPRIVRAKNVQSLRIWAPVETQRFFVLM